MYAKISLDLAIFAAQISSTTELVVDISSKKIWSVDIKSSDENSILSNGLVWSEHGGNSQDLVLVTKKGLELYKTSSSRSQCKLSRSMSCQNLIDSF